MTMDTMAAVAAKKLSKLVADDFREIFGSSHDDLAERVGGLARITIECLGRSDALYHNFEHTVLVTTVGRDILLGRTLSERIEPDDYSHLIVACLLHDIGFVRGVLSGDTKYRVRHRSQRQDGEAPARRLRRLARGLSCRSVEALRLRAARRFGVRRRRARGRRDRTYPLSPAPQRRPRRRVSSRGWFRPPISSASSAIRSIRRRPTRSFTNLRKSAATGSSATNSLPTSSRSIRGSTGTTVSMYIEDGMKYLALTASGRQWIANLHNHVFCAEKSKWLMGPQM